MVRQILLVMLAVLVFGLVGCNKKEEPQTEPVKTEAQLKAEAEKDINADNLDTELDKMESEINADQE